MDYHFSKKAAASASQYLKENSYWMNQLSGNIEKCSLPYDHNDNGNQRCDDVVKVKFPDRFYTGLKKLSRESDHKLYMILTTGLMVLLEKYTSQQDIIVGSPIYKQQIQGEFINTVLPLRAKLEDKMTFKELLLQVRQTIMEANENQNYPIEVLLYQLNMDSSDDYFPLFDIALLLENLHDKKYLSHINLNIMISFLRSDGGLQGEFQYNAALYKKRTIEKLIDHYQQILSHCLSAVGLPLAGIDMMSPEEKETLLIAFNNTRAASPGNKTIVELFRDQAARTPDNKAVMGSGQGLAYRQLDEESNQLARLLRARGGGKNTITAIMMEPAKEMILAALAILKTGGAYLPIDPGSPTPRILSILNDSSASMVVTEKKLLKLHSFSHVQGLHSSGRKIQLGVRRSPVSNLDLLPIPNRSLINYEKYQKYIGQAMVKNSITLQATRGCPYHCAYCHKIWPRKHAFRSAENIIEEIQVYTDMGIKRFSFVDDIFNLNADNSRWFFELILKKGLPVRLFFPNGLRGDLLTKDYIDLMIEAGTIGFALALETASPRLQKLIGKDLDIERLQENVEYICKKYPQVILELFTMHGFPSETQAEALSTLDFIKNIHWIHFPYINILKIYQNTEMVKLARENGISSDSLFRSENLAHHELPETLPFEKEFTIKYQSEFLNDYFLLKDRLLQVLPYQMKVLTEKELVQKYNSYLPADITCFDDLLQFTGISPEELQWKRCLDEKEVNVHHLNEKLRNYFPPHLVSAQALKVLLLDLSQFFSSDKGDMLYDVVEPPLGLMYLLTYLQQQLGSKISGRIARSRIDFDNYRELKALLEEFKPDVIGIRTLIFHKDFFHRTITMMRQWGIEVPVIAGGPYATSSYNTILQDRNIDLAVIGEGELTFYELIKAIIEHKGKLPAEHFLKQINGLAFVMGRKEPGTSFTREMVLMDDLELQGISRQPQENLSSGSRPGDPVYAIYTSGSTGTPKGVLIKNESLYNYITWFSQEANITGKDKTILNTSFAFDLGYTPVYSSLLKGGQLHVIPRETYLFAENFLSYIRENGITYLKLTPGLFSQLVASADFSTQTCGNLRLVVLGGEEINVKDVETAHQKCPHLQVMNHYGPTEATIGCIARFIDFKHWQDYKMNPTIGYPIYNTRIYIVNKSMGLLPIGIAGELCVSGKGLALGYLNQPELTAEKFDHDERKKIPGERIYRSYRSYMSHIYRTGDLARWQPDGNIQFLGRVDHQVKIRGYRIELGEIENLLLTHPGVTEAVVIAAQGNGDERNSHQYLYAYVVPVDSPGTPGISPEQLKEYLSRRLPDYMIPSHLFRLNRIPLNPNGKVNRKALPVPEPGAEGAAAAPANEIETKLVHIWSEVIGCDTEKISVNANFFELGGHSLKAVMLISKIHKTFNIKIPLAKVFYYPTIHGLAMYIKGAKRERFVGVECVEKKEYYVLASAQKRLYFLHQMEVGSIRYNTPRILILQGDLHKQRMKETFEKLLHRHENLRTSFHLNDDQPVQIIHTPVDFEIEYYDQVTGAGDRCKWKEVPFGQINAFGGKKGTESTEGRGGSLCPPLVKEKVEDRGNYGELPLPEEKIIKDFIRPFDLSAAPLLRVGLIKLLHTPTALRGHPSPAAPTTHQGESPGNRYILIVDMHHIISDGVSIGMFIKEFMQLYKNEAVPSLRVQYKDYSQWQNSRRIKELMSLQRQYWLSEFAGEPPVLNLPTDYIRPAIQSVEGNSISFEIGNRQLKVLNALVLKEGVTLYILFLAAFTLLLSKLSGQEDIIIGTPTMGRQHSDLEGVLGMFVNTLAIWNYPAGEKNLRTFLKEVKDKTFAIFENQDYQFEDLVSQVEVNRDTSRNPLFDVMFALHNVEIPQIEIPGLKLEPYQYNPQTSKFDLALSGIESEDKLVFTFEYCTRLFKRETIRRFTVYFLEIVSSMVENLDRRLYEVEIIPREEKQRLLVDFNDRAPFYSNEKNLRRLFEEQVKKTPDHIVLDYEDGQVTYNRLHKNLKQLAKIIKEL